MKRHQIEDEIDTIEKEISKECSEKISKIIKSHTEDICTIEGRFSSKKMWKLKQKVFKKVNNGVIAKRDFNGMLITNHKLLNELYLKTYQNRLSPLPIHSGWEKLVQLKDETRLQ